MLELLAHLFNIPHPEGLDQMFLQYLPVLRNLRFRLR